jgi:RNA-directed DNA polymerase
MVNGSQAHAEALWEEVASVLAPLGLRLSEAKSRVCHLDEGFDFLGFHEAYSRPGNIISGLGASQ